MPPRETRGHSPLRGFLAEKLKVKVRQSFNFGGIEFLSSIGGRDAFLAFDDFEIGKLKIKLANLGGFKWILDLTGIIKTHDPRNTILMISNSYKLRRICYARKIGKTPHSKKAKNASK